MKKRNDKIPSALDGLKENMTGDVQRMTSLEIAEISGKAHKDVMRAIRNMEPAWLKVHGRNFALKQRLVQTSNGASRMVPYYDLTKLECLYIATKFNDEARAKLVLRWAELEDFYQQSLRQELELMKGETKRLILEKAELMDELEEKEPLAEYCKQTLHSVSSFTVRQIAHQLSMTAQELNSLLCREKIQYGQSGSYVPYAPFARRGFTKSRTYNHLNDDGSVTTVHRTTWTEEGIHFITEMVGELRKSALPQVKMIQLTFDFV